MSKTKLFIFILIIILFGVALFFFNNKIDTNRQESIRIKDSIRIADSLNIILLAERKKDSLEQIAKDKIIENEIKNGMYASVLLEEFYNLSGLFDYALDQGIFSFKNYIYLFKKKIEEIDRLINNAEQEDSYLDKFKNNMVKMLNRFILSMTNISNIYSYYRHNRELIYLYHSDDIKQEVDEGRKAEKNVKDMEVSVRFKYGEFYGE